jgi:hypothetical protein
MHLTPRVDLTSLHEHRLQQATPSHCPPFYIQITHVKVANALTKIWNVFTHQEESKQVANLYSVQIIIAFPYMTTALIKIVELSHEMVGTLDWKKSKTISFLECHVVKIPSSLLPSIDIKVLSKWFTASQVSFNPQLILKGHGKFF